MSSTKIPKDTDEMQEDSSDNESVLEKPKKSTVAKEKKPYVMTEKRRLNCEKMREARNINVVALYSAYRTYLPYSLSPFRILNPDTVLVVTSIAVSFAARLAFVACWSHRN